MSPENKELVLVFFIIPTSLLFWLSLSVYFLLPEWQFTAVFWSSVIAVLLQLTVLALAILLIERSWVFVIAWAISSFTVFFWYQDFSLLVASLLLFFFGVVGYFRARREMQLVIKAGITRPLRKAIPLTTTFLAVLVAMASYVTVPNTSPDFKKIVPESLFIRLIGWGEPAITKIMPGFQKDISLAEYIVRVAAADLKKSPESFSPVERSLLIEQGVASLGKKTGVAIQSNDSVSYIFYQIGIRMIENQLVSYKNLFPVAFAVGLFVLLRFIAFFINWLVVFCAFLILQLLLRYKVVELRTITVELGTHSLT